MAINLLPSVFSARSHLSSVWPIKGGRRRIPTGKWTNSCLVFAWRRCARGVTLYLVAFFILYPFYFPADCSEPSVYGVRDLFPVTRVSDGHSFFCVELFLKMVQLEGGGGEGGVVSLASKPNVVSRDGLTMVNREHSSMFLTVIASCQLFKLVKI